MMKMIASAKREHLGILRDLIDLEKTPHSPEDLDKKVEKITLTSPQSLIVLTVCSLGATVVSILLKSETGYREITVLDEDWFNDKQSYMGRTCGRLAGRVAPYIVPGRSETDLFEFSSKDFPLHGGKIGFSHRVWKCTSTFCSQKSARACFELESDHNDQGHPGAVRVEVHFMAAIDESNKPHFDIRFRAKLDPNSPSQAFVNLASHVYFNLGNSKVGESITALQHSLFLPRSTKFYSKHFATESESVRDEFDFSENKHPVDKPLDHCFLIDQTSFSAEKELAAELSSDDITMSVKTSQPAVVVYTADHLNFKGICLEFQSPPNCPNIPEMQGRVRVTGKPKLKLKSEGVDSLSLRLQTPTRRASLSIGQEYDYDELTMHEFSFIQ